MKTEPVGCNAPWRPAPWSWFNIFKESAHKGKLQEADLMPIKTNENPGGKDNKIPVERLLQYNIEIFKSVLSYPDSSVAIWSSVQAKLLYFCRRFCSLIWICCPYLVLTAMTAARAELCCTLLGCKAPQVTSGQAPGLPEEQQLLARADGPCLQGQVDQQWDQALVRRTAKILRGFFPSTDTQNLF